MILWRIGLLVLAVGFLALGSNTPARPDHPALRDVFLSIPETWLPIPMERRRDMLRMDSVDIDDVNGYMEFNDSAEERYMIAEFRKADGSYVVALSYVGENIEVDPPQPDCRLYLLSKVKKAWVDVTSQYAPSQINPAFVYELPRRGTTIVIRNEQNVPVGRWVWDRTRFNIAR